MQITKCDRCGAETENGRGYCKHPTYESAALIGVDDGKDIELCPKCKVECREHLKKVREMTILMNKQFMNTKPNA